MSCFVSFAAQMQDFSLPQAITEGKDKKKCMFWQINQWTVHKIVKMTNSFCM